MLSKKILKAFALTLMLSLLAGLAYIKLQHGGGQAYPNLSTDPIYKETAVQKIVSLDFPPGNVAVSAQGRIFFNYHPFAKAERFVPATLFELVEGKPQPFPSAEFQSKLQGTFGMTVDRQNRLWLIEPRGLDHDRTRLMAIDISSRQVVFEHWLDKAQAQFAQDLRVSPDGNTVYLADTGLFRFTAASLLVLDVKSKSSRVVLDQTSSTQPQNWVTRTAHGPHKLGYGLVSFIVGLDGIELSADGAWLYFATMSHEGAYRIPTAILRNPAASTAEQQSAIEFLGKKPLSDGITLDAQGRLILTDIENGGLARLTPATTNQAAKLETLTKSAGITWADGVALEPQGSLLFTDSAIPKYIDQLARPPASEVLKAGAPYHIYRVKTAP
jgi:hypothetical protein